MESMATDIMTPSKEQMLVDVEMKEDDVVLVSVNQNGFTFRGALLKVKSWPCPDIPPLCPSPSASSVPTELLPERKDNTVVTTEQAQESSISELAPTPQSLPSSEQEKKSLQDNSDFAAIQHRWSYFQKNVPSLPRKNFPSRRERDRLDQVPKLRPRNFLCTKCKFALPGFSRAASQNVNSNCNPMDSDNNATADNVTCTSPSHTRKGKIPLKRASVSRTAVYDLSPSDWTNDSSVGTPKSEESGDTSVKQIPKASGVTGKKEKPIVTGKRKRPLLSEGLPKISMPAIEDLDNKNKETSAIATILSPPSGDNGLKMKIKLSSATSPMPMVEEKIKIKRTREKKPKAVVEAAVEVADEDEDDERPRLRIDDSFPSESTEVVTASQSLSNAPPVGSSVVKKKKAKAPVSNASASGISSEKREQLHQQQAPEPSSSSLPTPVARAVNQCVTKDGRTFSVGDIVWGKLTGYPWWPGKINHIVVCDDPMLERSASALMLSDPRSLPVLQYQEAQIEWYGQKASISYIEVNQLSHFVEDFDKKHKPKVRGSYLEAIKLATDAVRNQSRNAGHEASQDDEPEEKDIFSELAAMEVQTAKSRFDPSSISPAKSSSGADVYEFNTNDIFGRPVGGQRQRNSNFQAPSFNSLT